MAKQGQNKGGGATKGNNDKSKERLTDAEEKSIKDLFTSFKKGKNDYITRDDLVRGLRLSKLDPTKTEIDEIYRDLGIKPDDNITFDKFHAALEAFLLRSRNKTIDEKKADLRRSFQVFDKNKNGTIDEKELKLALTEMGDKLTDAEVKEMFKKVDKNSDGKIEINEFVNALLK